MNLREAKLLEEKTNAILRAKQQEEYKEWRKQEYEKLALMAKHPYTYDYEGKIVIMDPINKFRELISANTKY